MLELLKLQFDYYILFIYSSDKCYMITIILQRLKRNTEKNTQPVRLISHYIYRTQVLLIVCGDMILPWLCTL